MLNLEKHKTKRFIAEAIRGEMIKKDISYRRLSEEINGLNYTQIHRVTSEKNYNIDTLLKILDALNLEIEIKKR